MKKPTKSFSRLKLETIKVVLELFVLLSTLILAFLNLLQILGH